jgi:peroxiredoxin
MKKIIIALLVLLAACNTSNKSPISGNIEEGAGGKVFFEFLEPNGAKILDSALVDKKGNFYIKSKPKERSYYRLRFQNESNIGNIQNQDFIILITDSTEQIKITAKAPMISKGYKVEGSQESEDLALFIVKVGKTAELRDSLINAYQQKINQGYPDPESLSKQIDDEYLAIMNEQEVFIKALIMKDKGSLLTLETINFINIDDNVELIKEIKEALNQRFPNNPFVVNFNYSIQEKLRFSKGMDTPDLSLPTPDGKLVNLHSLKGKYVLLEFWASWCRPCRMENPNLVRTYEKYRNKGFEIYAVSLDRERQDWIEAIKQDGLKWIQVSDLQFWNSIAAQTYGVQSIPANFLLDRDGKILAKNLRGADLDRKLEEVIGN